MVVTSSAPASATRLRGPSIRRTRPSYRPREVAVSGVFLLPSLVIFALFIFYPLYRTGYLSVHGTDVIGRPTRFIWFKQFAEIFTSAEFGKVLLVTAGFTVMVVLPATVLGLGLALALRAKISGVGLFRTLFATPFAFSAATASVAFAVCFNPASGVFNGLLHHLGFGPVDWLTSEGWALPAVAAVTVWMQLGYNLLVLSAGLQSIPQELYEAAQVDGSTGWHTLRNITLPLLGPSMFLVIITSTISALQAFAQIQVLTQGGPRRSTTTLVYSMYDSAFAYGSSNFGVASAQAVVLLAVVALITIVQFRVLGGRVFYQ